MLISNRTPILILNELNVSEHFPEFEQEHFERCPECGSTVFRIYKEPVEECVYEQFICAICNHRYGGWVNDYKTILESKTTKYDIIERKTKKKQKQRKKTKK